MRLTSICCHKLKKDNDLAFDLNGDGSTNEADRTVWIDELKKTWAGDANFDGEFNSGDFVVAFTAGKYESGEMAGWAEGDWNGDMMFDSGGLRLRVFIRRLRKRPPRRHGCSARTVQHDSDATRLLGNPQASIVVNQIDCFA